MTPGLRRGEEMTILELKEYAFSYVQKDTLRYCLRTQAGILRFCRLDHNHSKPINASTTKKGYVDTIDDTEINLTEDISLECE